MRHVVSVPSLQNFSNPNHTKLHWIFMFGMQPANSFLFQKSMRVLHLLFLNKLTYILKKCSFHSNVSAIDVGYVFDHIFILFFFFFGDSSKNHLDLSSFGVLMQIRSCLHYDLGSPNGLDQCPTELESSNAKFIPLTWFDIELDAIYEGS